MPAITPMRGRGAGRRTSAIANPYNPIRRQGDDYDALGVGTLPVNVRYCGADAGGARWIAAALDAVVQQDAVADFEVEVAAGVGADLHNFAGHIAAQDVRETAAVAGAQVEVEMVEGAGPDAQQDFAGADFGFGTVAIGQDIRPASLVDINGFHNVGSLRW